MTATGGPVADAAGRRSRVAQAVEDARGGIGRYFGFYNDVRPHQSLGYRTPQEVYFDGRN